MISLYLRFEAFLQRNLHHLDKLSLLGSIIFGTLFGLGAAYMLLLAEWKFLALSCFPVAMTTMQMLTRERPSEEATRKDMTDRLLLISSAASALLFLALNFILLSLK